jgi:putative flippase GtrA
MIKKETRQKILFSKTDNLIIQFFRYGFAGGVAFLVDFSLLYILTDIFHVYYLISAALSFIPGVLVNYTLSVSWVFKRRAIKKKKVEFVLFALIACGGLVLNELFIWFFTEITGFYYLISKLCSTALVYFWNFSAKKFFLFR